MGDNGRGNETDTPRCDLENQLQIVQDEMAAFLGIEIANGGNQTHPRREIGPIHMRATYTPLINIESKRCEKNSRNRELERFTAPLADLSHCCDHFVIILLCFWEVMLEQS
jgi:hypothetical protein